MKCVCGHDFSSHTRMHGKDRGCAALIDIPGGGEVECPCCYCRPVVPWPTEVGWWWCNNPESAIVRASRYEGGFAICPIGDDYAYCNENMEHYANCSFVRLLEPNPFGATT